MSFVVALCANVISGRWIKPEVLLNLIIQPVDVLHSLRKWDGWDFVMNDGTSIERRWKATDREFLKIFSHGEITESVLARFAANNNNDNPSKRTGGYSITRKFWGGLPPGRLGFGTFL